MCHVGLGGGEQGSGGCVAFGLGLGSGRFFLGQDDPMRQQGNQICGQAKHAGQVGCFAKDAVQTGHGVSRQVGVIGAIK